MFFHASQLMSFNMQLPVEKKAVNVPWSEIQAEVFDSKWTTFSFFGDKKKIASKVVILLWKENQSIEITINQREKKKWLLTMNYDGRWNNLCCLVEWTATSIFLIWQMQYEQSHIKCTPDSLDTKPLWSVTLFSLLVKEIYPDRGQAHGERRGIERKVTFSQFSSFGTWVVIFTTLWKLVAPWKWKFQTLFIFHWTLLYGFFFFFDPDLSSMITKFKVDKQFMSWIDKLFYTFTAQF